METHHDRLLQEIAKQLSEGEQAKLLLFATYLANPGVRTYLISRQRFIGTSISEASALMHNSWQAIASKYAPHVTPALDDIVLGALAFPDLLRLCRNAHEDVVPSVARPNDMLVNKVIEIYNGHMHRVTQHLLPTSGWGGAS